MPDKAFKEKFIAFVDIVGFKHLVNLAELGGDLNLSDILEYKAGLAWPENHQMILDGTPPICPESNRHQDNLDFKVTQISDCVVISAEISPTGAVNLVNHCRGIAMRLLKKGLLVRGYVTKGIIWHTDHDFVGSGYQTAYENETKVSALKIDGYQKAPPFIEINMEVSNYIQNEGDPIVKQMFDRFVECDGDLCAIYPFKVFQNFGSFDPAENLRIQEDVKALIDTFKSKVSDRVKGLSGDPRHKADHYLKALEDEYRHCCQGQEMIEQLMNTPFPASNA